MKVSIVEDGPIIFKTDGEFACRVGDTSETRSGSVALCRCGQSSGKPYCDGAHRKAEFKAAAGEIELSG